MNRKIKILLIGILLLSPLTLSAQNRFDSLVTVGVRQIYNIKFEKAQRTFNIVKKEFPNHPSGYFFDAMITWWKILLNLDNESFDDEFTDKLENVIDFCDKLLEKNPNNVDAIFFKGGALGFRGRLYAIRESWFDAAVDGKDAMPLVNRAYEIDPQNVDVQLGFGIYNYYAEAVPQKYPFVKPFMIFFPDGNVKLGLEQINNVAHNGKYAKYEALYFLATIYYGFEENYSKAAEYLKILVKEFPENPRFQLMLGRTWVRRNNYSVAAEIFRDVLKKNKRELKGYDTKAIRESYYYLGMLHRQKNTPDSAKIYFELSRNLSTQIDDDEPSGFLVNSTLYLGNTYDQLGRRAEAIKMYEQVLDYDEYNDSHSRAEQYLKRPYAKI